MARPQLPGTDLRSRDRGGEGSSSRAERAGPVVRVRNLIACRSPSTTGSAVTVRNCSCFAIRTVASLIESGIPTLVCCLRRDESLPLPIVAAALALWSITTRSRNASKSVTYHHPSDVSPGLWREITRLPHELLEVEVPRSPTPGQVLATRIEPASEPTGSKQDSLPSPRRLAGHCTPKEFQPPSLASMKVIETLETFSVLTPLLAPLRWGFQAKIRHSGQDTTMGVGILGETPGQRIEATART